MTAFSFSDRRSFLKKSGAGLAGMLLIPDLLRENILHKDQTRRLTILHTNDMHSRIDPFPNDDPQYAGLGGMERRAAMIATIRKTEQNVLLVDAGDIFQGTPYFNFFGGEPELRLMSDMGYEAATMGNHDFDNGLEGFLKVLHHAQFPFLCSNYDFSGTLLNKHTFDHKIIEKGGLKIGLFGLGIELKGLVTEKNYGKTVWLDPIEIARDRSKMLKQAGCHLIICISHLGYQYANEKVSDVKLAKESTMIDIILGGHTHTFMEEAAIVTNKTGKPVLVNQAGWGGLRLGRIDISFNKSRSGGTSIGEISYLQSSNRNVI
ncbi:MAG: bifunctional metallophosphatase/5'-nucleotidase [Flavobacteriales bacterium]